MTRGEMLAFFGAQRWVALGTLDPDGTPVGDVVPVLLDDVASFDFRKIRRPY